MTGIDLCVNKPHCAAAVRPWESDATTSTLPPARVRWVRWRLTCASKCLSIIVKKKKKQSRSYLNHLVSCHSVFTTWNVLYAEEAVAVNILPFTGAGMSFYWHYYHFVFEIMTKAIFEFGHYRCSGYRCTSLVFKTSWIISHLTERILK